MTWTPVNTHQKAGRSVFPGPFDPARPTRFHGIVKERVVFRAALAVRLATALALIHWVVVLGMVLAGPDIWSVQTFASVGFFILFFGVLTTYYWSMRYEADDVGLTYRGPTQRTSYAWEDIQRVDRSAIPLGGYWVSTKRGGFVLSTFIGHGDRLRDLIVTRAGLFPEPSS